MTLILCFPLTSVGEHSHMYSGHLNFSMYLLLPFAPFLLRFYFIFLKFVHFERERVQVGRDRERGQKRIPSKCCAISVEPGRGHDLSRNQESDT